MIPYSGPKLSDLYTLSQSKLLENHTLHSSTHLHRPYTAVTPPPPGPSRDGHNQDSYPPILLIKELCQEEWWILRAVLDQFFAEVITCSSFTRGQNVSYGCEEAIQQILITEY